MARMTSMAALEQKITKAQEQVSKTKKAYDAAIAELSDLLDKRDALRRDPAGRLRFVTLSCAGGSAVWRMV